jgi:hypothetical protein
MALVRFFNGEDFVELDILSRDQRGDAKVVVRVQSQDFVAYNNVWLDRDNLEAFTQDLVLLDGSLKGSAARLASLSPQELDLVISPVDSAGHMQAVGSTGRWNTSQRPSFWHDVHFGFVFEPQQLGQAVRALRGSLEEITDGKGDVRLTSTAEMLERLYETPGPGSIEQRDPDIFPERPGL